MKGSSVFCKSVCPYITLCPRSSSYPRKINFSHLLAHLKYVLSDFKGCVDSPYFSSSRDDFESLRMAMVSRDFNSNFVPSWTLTLLKQLYNIIQPKLEAHEGKLNHRGIVEIEKQLRRNVYLLNIPEIVNEITYNCSSCQTNKYETPPNKQNLQFTPVCTKPFEIIHIDTFQVKRQKFLKL